MKNRFQATAFVVISLVTLNGCEALQDRDSLISNLSQMQITMDPELTQDERTLLVSDLNKALEYKVQVEPKSYYGKTFGSGDSNGVIQYLSERVHYVLPESVDLQSRLNLAPSVSPLLHAPSPTQASQIYTMAINVGTVLWFEALILAPHEVNFRVGDTQVPLSSSRIGIVQMGQGYTLKKDGKYAFPQLARIATIVHEARHSDCTGGLVRSDLDKIQDGDIPENNSCGHLHVRCPAGHDYEGAFACDGEAWGAYAVQALYAAALVKNCSNCTTDEQNQAVIIFADSLNRVVPIKDMLAGKLGDPDMSSSTEIH